MLSIIMFVDNYALLNCQIGFSGFLGKYVSLKYGDLCEICDGC